MAEAPRGQYPSEPRIKTRRSLALMTPQQYIAAQLWALVLLLTEKLIEGWNGGR